MEPFTIQSVGRVITCFCDGIVVSYKMNKGRTVRVLVLPNDLTEQQEEDICNAVKSTLRRPESSSEASQAQIELDNVVLRDLAIAGGINPDMADDPMTLRRKSFREQYPKTAETCDQIQAELRLRGRAVQPPEPEEQPRNDATNKLLDASQAVVAAWATPSGDYSVSEMDDAVTALKEAAKALVP